MSPSEREPPQGAGGTPRPETVARADKRAEALRANLRRRKAQARGRAEAHLTQAREPGPSDD